MDSRLDGGDIVCGTIGIEPQREQLHEVGRDPRMGGKGVVDVLDRETRGDPLPIRSVGPQNPHLMVVDAAGGTRQAEARQG